jgi:hypothetical protein
MQWLADWKWDKEGRENDANKLSRRNGICEVKQILSTFLMHPSLCVLAPTGGRGSKGTVRHNKVQKIYYVMLPYVMLLIDVNIF